MAKVGDVIDADNAGWRFSGEACTHFNQHVRKSVPYYDDGHRLCLGLADFFLQPPSRCYDLGCSTGRLLERLGERFSHDTIELLGIDCEPDMVAAATTRCEKFPNVHVTQADLAVDDLQPADLVIAYYTLQFIAPRHRQKVFSRIYDALNWGGGFILFEKVRAPDARFQDMMSALYNDYKLDQGYSGDEIIAKARSLKGVLEPFSHEGNLGLLQRAGFVDVMTVFKHVCFEGFVAIK